MKSLFYRFCGLSFLFIVLIAISCKKEGSVDEQSEVVYSVNFKFSGFNAVSNPLKIGQASINKLANNGANTSNHYEGYLYFWSFNAQNLTPDIRYQKSLAPSIGYADGSIPNSYVNSTYSFDGYAGGSALGFSGGAHEVLIKLPIKDVIEVYSFGFDMGSPGTGPKDFEISYSFDEGTTYTMLSEVNQFSNPGTSNAKNSYIYSLEDITISSDHLWFKILPKAGERGEAGTFNENSGSYRIDNVQLSGMAPIEQSSLSIDKLHYFLFHQDKPDIIFSGEADNPENLELDLPIGSYSVCFVSNASNEDLLFLTNPSITNFYAGNLFSNSEASIFGYVGTIHVIREANISIEMERLYSQIKIEFTDAIDLSMITKISISQEHDPFFWNPFDLTMSNPILDQSSIELEEDFQGNKQLVFNQFMGKTVDFVPVNYVLHVYEEDDLLRTFTLGSTLKNNMQLVFRGEILSGMSSLGTFHITKNENWEGDKSVDF